MIADFNKVIVSDHSKMITGDGAHEKISSFLSYKNIKGMVTCNSYICFSIVLKYLVLVCT